MTIFINDKEAIKEVELNATTYVLKEKPEIEFPSMFKLTVKDDSGNITEEKEHAFVTALYKVKENEWYLCFGEIDKKDYQIAKQQAQIEYLAMVLDENIGE